MRASVCRRDGGEFGGVEQSSVGWCGEKRGGNAGSEQVERLPSLVVQDIVS